MPFKTVLKFWTQKAGTTNATGVPEASSVPNEKWHSGEFLSKNFPRLKPKPSTVPVKPLVGNFYDSSTGDERHLDPLPINGIVHELSNDQQSTADQPTAAPLAKPEPLVELEKPAFDVSQFTKQAAAVTPSQRRGTYGSSSAYSGREQVEQDRPFQLDQQHRTLRFADEDPIGGLTSGLINIDDDDPGIMSEAETSATSGPSSHVRRMKLQQLQQKHHQQQQQQQQQKHHMLERESPTINRQPVTVAVSAQSHQQQVQQQPQSQPHQIRSQYQATQAKTLRWPMTQNSEEKLSGLVFLQHQGETKRAVLPIDQENGDGSIKYGLRSFDDVRSLFARTFDLPPDYLQYVKIYIQDPTKTDLFYELDDLSDIRDRSVLKLHESPAPRSSSPAPIQAQLVSAVSTTAPIVDLKLPAAPPPDQRSILGGYHQRQSVDDMNYFSEPEFDVGGDYRLRKSASTSNYYQGYQQQQQPTRRQYATLDRYYTPGGGVSVPRPQSAGVPQSSRGSYRAVVHPVPPKPERHFGPGIPSGGRASMRHSQSPPRMGARAYGHSTDPEEAYGRVYRDYAPSPTSEEPIYHRAGSVSRSGSVTPVIDEEARVRMMNMEKQLASLSTLVHSALMSKNVNDSVYKDLEMLRREIFNAPGSGNVRDDVSDSSSVSRFSDISSDKGSYQSNHERDIGYPTAFSPITVSDGSASVQTSISPPSNSHLSPETRQALRTARRKVGDVQLELKHLRRMAQVNAQASRDILKDAFDRIRVILNTNKHLHIFANQIQQQNTNDHGAVSGDRRWIDQEQERHRANMRRVERDLNDLEKQVETLRQKVISGDRKLRMSEVENFTDVLTQIGRTAATLKTNFPTLHDRLNNVMSAEMEKVVREEKFLKEEPPRLDAALKRCKKLTSTMVTMKKLAMVQDPNAYYGGSSTTNRSQSPVKATSIIIQSEPALKNGASSPPPSSSTSSTTSSSSHSYHRENVTSSMTKPPTSTTTATTLGNGNGYGSSCSDAESDSLNIISNGISTGLGQQPSGNSSSLSSSSKGANGHVLDSLLEELQNVAKTASIDQMNLVVDAPTTTTTSSSSSSSINGTISSGTTTATPMMTTTPTTTTTMMMKNGNVANGALTNQGEKRVGFADQVQIHRPDGDSDTIKRCPKPGQLESPTRSGYENGVVGGGTGSILRNTVVVVNGNGSNGGGPGSRRRSASPTGGHSSQLFAAAVNRSHSGTPSSVTSEPGYYHNHHQQHHHQQQQHHHQHQHQFGQQLVAPPPPPPPRYSSRSMLGQQNGGVDMIDDHLLTTTKQSNKRTPAAMVQTNAVDDEPRLLKSASSSESINSQDGRRRTDDRLAPGKPPPPPPPPRNKQEMLEQRQHELLTKQMYQNRYVKF